MSDAPTMPARERIGDIVQMVMGEHVDGNLRGISVALVTDAGMVTRAAWIDGTGFAVLAGAQASVRDILDAVVSKGSV